VPALDALGLDVNPSLLPDRYPGRLVQADSLMVGPWLYPMAARRDATIGEWLVRADGGPIGLTTGDVPLADALVRAGAAPVSGRYPVLAVGSNAAPGQLVHKFGARAVSTVIPLTVASVQGIGVGHSAHVSMAGYVPYTPVRDALNSRRLVVLWLDEDQLSLVNESEPNYLPATVSGGQYAAVLTSGEALSSYSLYRSRWGAFRPTAATTAIEGTTQAELYALLGALRWFVRLVPEARRGVHAAIAALRQDEARRVQVRTQKAVNGHVTEDGLPALGFRPVTYG
jgi:hypothetical protein